MFAAVYVPRLANPLWSDVEFTGWVSPIAHRMVEGQRIYRDFTLPIPPASFALLAAVQMLLHRFALLDELWVCTISQMIMLAAAWLLVRTFSTARNATLVVIATSPVLIATPKEIAYDQTALAVAWIGLAVLAKALTVPERRKRLGWLASAGLAAAVVVAFKSSTGIGALGGLGLAMIAVSAIAWKREGRGALRRLGQDWAAVAGGVAAGLVLTVLLVAALGGSVPEFYRVVFVDGPELKGGRSQAIFNLLSYTILQTPTHVSLLSALVVGWVLVRVIRQRGALEVPTEIAPDRAERGVPGLVFAIAAGGWTVMIFGLGALLLLGNAPSIPLALQVGAGFGGALPMLGLMLLVFYLLGNLRAAQPGADRRGAFAAVTVAAGFISLAHNLSDPTHRPFYDNNPIIPLAIFSLLLAFDQSRLALLKAASVGLMVMALFGGKFQRYLDARYPVGPSGFWQGLSVSANGQVLLRAAAHVRDLAGPHGTVLMLPEDPMFEALVGRPRPRLKGAIVFVDQFPQRLLASDLATLESSPPDVVIEHPREAAAWHTVYAIWNLNCAAAKLQNEFTSRVLEPGYRVESTFDTWMFRGPGLMDVYVRKNQAP